MSNVLGALILILGLYGVCLTIRDVYRYWKGR